MGLYSLNRVRLRLRAEKEQSGNAARLLELSTSRDQAVLSVLLLQNLCGYFLTVSTSATLLAFWGLDARRVEFYSALVLSPCVFVFGDVVPKNWFRIQADRLMYPVAPILHWSVRLLRLTGLPWLLGRASRAAARLVGEEREEWLGGRGEVIGLLREGAEGVLSEEQTEIVERVMAFSRIQLRSIMIPRRRVVSVPIDVDRRTFEHTVRLHPYSRLPVLERDGRSVAGVVNVAEVLADETFRLRDHLKPPLFLRGSETAASALVQLQRSDVAIAIVSEPRQPFIGLVTLKDVVEEIFGELPAW
jgi:putative hemolysin